jgi:hypothetical protein
MKEREKSHAWPRFGVLVDKALEVDKSEALSMSAIVSLQTSLVSYQAMAQQFAAPAGKTYLLYGEKPIFLLSLRMAAYGMTHGSTSISFPVLHGSES